MDFHQIEQVFAFLGAGKKASEMALSFQQVFKSQPEDASKESSDGTRDLMSMAMIIQDFLGHAVATGLIKFSLSLCLGLKRSPQRAVVVLLGGTSGSGKSTLSSLLSSRLGFPVISTDHIRHFLRSYMPEQDPCKTLINCSSYQVVDRLKPQHNLDGDASGVLIEGLEAQSDLVQRELYKLLFSLQSRGECVIIEGIHMTCKHIKILHERLSNCIPFIVHIGNRTKHLERFAIRSKYMTIDTVKIKTVHEDRYRSNFERIRRMQDYLVAEAALLNVCKRARVRSFVISSHLCPLDPQTQQYKP